MRRLEKIGAFGLTEPHGGSDVAGGLETTARRDGDDWVLDGAKRWIGNGTFADLIVVWARDVADDQVKGFVVEKDMPGFSATKMENKLALRITQNADLTFDGVRVPEANRLQNANSFDDTNAVLRSTRGSVAWSAVGVLTGVYEVAVQYAKDRDAVRPADRRLPAHPGPPRAHPRQPDRVAGHGGARCPTAGRRRLPRRAGRAGQVVLHRRGCARASALARELMGGNGILLEYGMARYFNDAEALYSYEGTREINTLIVGRAITGESAFV